MSTTPGAEPLERTMESFVNAEHFEELYAPGARGGVACITPTSPWTLPNGTFMRQYRRQPPRETSHVFRWKHVALGMMATAVHRRTGSHGAQIESSADAACRTNPSHPDLVACIASTWLPPDLDVLLLHDCTKPCLEELANSTATAGPSAASRSACEAPRASNGTITYVHHSPFQHADPPAWAASFPQFQRRCYYGPMHGSHQASYLDPGRYPSLEKVARSMTNDVNRLMIGENATDELGVEVPVSRSHNWAKLASLLLALSELMPHKLYYVKIDDDTVVEPTLLLRFLTTVHSHLPGSFLHPPPVAFGSHDRMYHFLSCAASPPGQSCVTDAFKHGHNHCMRGSKPWLQLLEDAARRYSGGNATWEEEYVRQRSAIPATSYPAGMIYGLSRSALHRLVQANCVQRLATSVTCTERIGAPSPLIEDTAVGLCFHIHAIPRVQCNCFTQNVHRGQAFRCPSPISLHPAKSAREYLGFTNMVTARAAYECAHPGQLTDNVLQPPVSTLSFELTQLLAPCRFAFFLPVRACDPTWPMMPRFICRASKRHLDTLWKAWDKSKKLRAKRQCMLYAQSLIRCAPRAEPESGSAPIEAYSTVRYQDQQLETACKWCTWHGLPSYAGMIGPDNRVWRVPIGLLYTPCGVWTCCHAHACSRVWLCGGAAVSRRFLKGVFLSTADKNPLQMSRRASSAEGSRVFQGGTDTPPPLQRRHYLRSRGLPPGPRGANPQKKNTKTTQAPTRERSRQSRGHSQRQVWQAMAKKKRRHRLPASLLQIARPTSHARPTS